MKKCLLTNTFISSGLMTLFNGCRAISKLVATTIDFLKFTIINFAANVFGINLAHSMTIAIDDL